MIRKQADLHGLVLAGGYSSRMGTDKSLIEYHGVPQRNHLFELLEKFCLQVFTSCRPIQGIPDVLHPIHDQYSFSGPLNGILSAFKHDPDKSWLAVAVDMPYVDATALQLLISLRDKTKMATCFFNAAIGQAEPLLTIWEPHCLPALLKFAGEGKTSPRDFLRDHPVNVIHPPDEKTVVNINYPEVGALKKDRA